jgi:hypothetical protein
MFDINKLIGIPFKLNKKDFSGCDCRGIVWLYYKYVKEKEIPFSDGKPVIFRDKSKDIERIINEVKNIAKPVNFIELHDGDIVILKNERTNGALGVCINNKQLLHMDLNVGSCLTKLRYLKDMFLCGFRICET